MNKKPTILIITLLNVTLTAHAEVVIDGSLGSAAIELKGPEFAIDANLGQQKGSNLFHSFAKFNLNSNETAIFSGPNTITHIISRVTGGTPSYINGKLSSTITNADMYFINPAGVMFGPAARLDIPGSLHVSTADYLRLEDGTRFEATHPTSSLLTVAPPAAFGFLDDSPAGISKRGGFLALPAGETISLIGGDLDLQDTKQFISPSLNTNTFILSIGGQINLISVASQGEINLKDLSEVGIDRFGTIRLTDSTPWNNKMAGNLDVSGNGGGKIYLRGGEIIIDNGYLFADTLGDANGRGIVIKAQKELSLINQTRITSQLDRKASGNAGNITITADEITLNQGSQIVSNAEKETSGSAGYIEIEAKKSMNISGSVFLVGLGLFKSGILTNVNGIGNGGRINVTTPLLMMTDNGVIRADTQNNGNIPCAGNAGDILIQTEQLTLKEGAQIKVSAGNRKFLGKTGQAGRLTIQAQHLLISGAKDKNEPSGLFSNTFTSGQGGSINLSTHLLEIEKNGTIQSATQGLGDGGYIDIITDKLDIRSGGWISTESQFSLGKAGIIKISSNQMMLHEAEIRTQSEKTGGNNIFFNITDHLNLTNSFVSARAQGETRNDRGGNIQIQQPHTFTLKNSNLLANAYGGNGGNIDISTDNFQGENSQIDVSSTLGLNGHLFFNQVMVRDDYLHTQPILSPDELGTNRCFEPGGTSTHSQFWIGGRDGLTRSPEELQR